MKILLTGGNGMLGRTLQKELSSDYDIISTDLPEVDITNFDSVNQALQSHKVDVVIHCAAMTAVDKCESEKEFAFKLNELGSKNVAQACQLNSVRLIGISTDYVFAGNLDRAYTEYDQATGGDTIYGQSKFAGEVAIKENCANHVITRISWLYGAGGPSFVHAMIDLSKKGLPELKVVNDQIGNPTSTVAVANGLKEILKNPELTGVFHLTCEGEASWYDFASKIFSLMNIEQKVVPCSSDEFVRPAPRPKNSRLEKLRLKENNLAPMENWDVALKNFLVNEFDDALKGEK